MDDSNAVVVVVRKLEHIRDGAMRLTNPEAAEYSNERNTRIVAANIAQTAVSALALLKPSLPAGR